MELSQRSRMMTINQNDHSSKWFRMIHSITPSHMLSTLLSLRLMYSPVLCVSLRASHLVSLIILRLSLIILDLELTHF